MYDAGSQPRDGIPLEQPKNYLVFFSTRQKLKLFTFVKSIEIREMVSFELDKEI